MMICAGLSLLILVAAFPASESIRCYKCSTATHEGCGDDFDAAFIPQTECFFLYNGCKKTRENGVIERDCSATVGDSCLSFLNTDMCNCKSHLCNDTTTPIVSKAMIIVTVIAGIASRLL